MVIKNRLKYANYYLIIVFGSVMALGVFIKLVFNLNINSDWFWFLAGFGIAIEAMIACKKQKLFDRKYKIIERE